MKFKFNYQMLLVALATFAILFGGKQVWDHYNRDDALQVCLIAGEGVHISYGDTSILMDALYREGFPEDKLPSDALMTRIENAQMPYGDVDLVTVSHKHIDHFGVPSLLKYMENNEDAYLLMPPEAAAEFFDGGGHGFADRVFSIYPTLGAPQTHTLGGIDVTVYNLDHRTEVENIGVYFELGGKTFFHMGDYSSADFEGNGIKDLKVDYLLAPYWYFRNEPNFALMSENMSPAFYVPIHMPGRELPADFQERIGMGFDDFYASVAGRADNVLMLYEEGSCFRPEE